jgi:hypothetical protein
MQSKKEMTFVSGINNPDENQCEEAGSEAESRRSLKEILDSIGGPADQALTSGGIYFNLLHEVKLRASQAEIVEFLLEDVVRTEGPDATPLSSEEVSLLDEAKARVNNAVRSIDFLLGQIPYHASRNDLLTAFIDALLYAYILGNYSTLSQSREKWLEKIARKRAAILNAEKSAKERSKNAEKKWQSYAEGIAKQIRAKEPNKSQEKVADEIGSLWKLPLNDLPGHRTLVRFISKLEKEKKLPPRAS